MRTASALAVLIMLMLLLSGDGPGISFIAGIISGNLAFILAAIFAPLADMVSDRLFPDHMFAGLFDGEDR